MRCCVETLDQNSICKAVSLLYHAWDLKWCPLSSFSLELLGAPLGLGIGKGSLRVR